MSERYTFEDNSTQLDPTYLLDLGIFKDFRKNEHHFYVEFEMRNLTNQLYRTASLGNMPGRNFVITLRYDLK